MVPDRKNREWILLADKAHAKIFTRNFADDVLQPHIVLTHPAAQQRQSEQGTGRPGRGQGSANTMRYAYEDHADFAEQESVEFLNKVAAKLNSAVKNDEMDKIILVALPKTLAVLNSELSEAAKARITAEYAKNLIGVAEHTLADRLVALKD
ncbi:MAG: host attachment protein [Sneathiella sp.]|nr:host attachment protein [Sneathiella sp.]